MKVETNLRAGKQTQKQGSSADSTSVSTPDVYVPPVSRCAGI